MVNEPDTLSAISILRGLRERYENHHKYGARPIKRMIQKIVLNELSRQILAGKIQKNQEVTIDRENEGIKISNTN
jgi:ATP-dependent Clp protease ATP-binding subunit ClpA